MKTKPVIRIWRFVDAPDKYKKLSLHGGDEDWVGHVPVELVNEWIGWMEEGTSFGCCCVSVHKLEDGSEIRIGAHA